MTADTEPSPASEAEEHPSRVPRWIVVLVLAVVGVGALAEVFIYGYLDRQGWVGGTRKTFWDYLDVFLVPVAVGAATVWFAWEQSRSAAAQEKREREAQAAQEKREREAQEARRERE